MKERRNFEESFEKLEAAAAALRDDSVSLEDSLKNFEAASQYYKECKSILDEAKQRLMILDKANDSITDRTDQDLV